MVTTAKTPVVENVKILNSFSESEEDNVQKKINRGLKQRKKGSTTILSADSFTELRGVLEGATDDEGHEGTEMLHAARESDKQKDDEVSRRLGPDADNE